ncbi:hypothetical protein LEP1GSC196_1790 [Leptospira meyeri serovar Semaranga str. Veldrot Semarang 173]|nr:hypothetical protein LEP1GSC196_1790 [Leptospira meyeri serovar Semaranga str. Veldrot Semarang 173]
MEEHRKSKRTELTIDSKKNLLLIPANKDSLGPSLYSKIFLKTT